MGYNNQIIDELLHRYQPALGEDYSKYRNHVYRVFLNCLLMDAEQGHEEKYAYAAFFHDIGIWTDHTIDYLDPSIARACEYLAQHGKGHLVADITLMIYWHHKMRSYRGIQAGLVEVFRKADWMDVSLGLLSFGCSRKILRSNWKLFPNLGFHLFLCKKIFKNFLRHPLNPLPMFKN